MKTKVYVCDITRIDDQCMLAADGTHNYHISLLILFSDWLRNESSVQNLRCGPPLSTSPGLYPLMVPDSHPQELGRLRPPVHTILVRKRTWRHPASVG
jgi:hypothetical protein